jgi:hypothetical protein
MYLNLNRTLKYENRKEKPVKHQRKKVNIDYNFFSLPYLKYYLMIIIINKNILVNKKYDHR